MTSYKVLSIDAWADSCGDCDACQYYKKYGTNNNKLEACWTWNNWHTAATLEVSDIDDDKAIIELLINEGLLKDKARELVTIEDDGYNVIVCTKKTREPLYAIEYGSKLQ